MEVTGCRFLVFGFEGMTSNVERIIAVNSLREFTIDNLRSKFSIFLDSSMVEHTAVNRGVVGSSPTRGVKKAHKHTSMFVGFFI